MVFILPERSFRPTDLTLTLKEGFASAFSGNTGQFNQNAPTRVQIRITGLPEGVSVTFPDSVPSTSIESNPHRGGRVLKPNCRPRTTIGRSRMSFTPQVASNRRVEAFQLDYTVEMDTPEDESTDNSQPPEGLPVVAQPAAVFLQATLAPERGMSSVTEVLAFLGIRRSLFLPRRNSLCREFETYFPISFRLGPLRLQFTNRSSLDLNVRLEALGPEGRLVLGPDIVNPASLPVDQGEQVSVAIGRGFFGFGILEVEAGTIAARTRRAETGAIFLLGDDQTRGGSGAASQPPRTRFLLPSISREGEEPFHDRALVQSIGRSRHPNPGLPL